VTVFVYNEALIEKFQKSCITDERESYRLKIFYSSGTARAVPCSNPSEKRGEELE
jgi:hypothetical protein